MQYGKLSDTTKKLKFVVVIVSHTSLEGYSAWCEIGRSIPESCIVFYSV